MNACLDIGKITDNKTFWKTISPLFSNKSYSTNSRITLFENGEVLSEETKVTDTFNEFFSSLVKALKIENDNNLLTDDIEETDPVLKAIKKYKTHPSILRTKSFFKHPKVSSFKYFNVGDVKREINNLNSKKATPEGDIPVKTLKWNSDIIAPTLTDCYNQNIKNSTFPNELKNADISPVFKKKDRHGKSNYRPVSILPLLSKPFQHILCEQIDSYTKDILSRYQGGFRKRFSSQHSLLGIFQKWKKALDNGGSCGALLEDLSKAFDCIVHDLLLAKLSAYGFDYNSLKLINSFLSGTKFRMKIGSSYSPYFDLLVGVPQGSILGLSLFNIYICDNFQCDCETNIINYADDTTLYDCEPNMDLVSSKLEKGTSTVFTWFQNNYLKANSGKSHLLTASDNIQHINVKGNHLSSSKSEELLGILIDHKLTFENYLLNIVEKVNQKLHALARISKYMPRKKLRIITKAFVSLQFAYCPLI